MELFLCRHGQTEHNDKGIVQGQMDPKMNGKGRPQAKKLGDRLAEESISRVYSSSMTRAVETAETVAEPHDVEVETTDSLIEPPREEYEGEKLEKLIGEVKKSEKEDYIWKTENGENLKEVQERSVKFLDSIMQKHVNEKIIIVSDAATIRCILLGIIGHSAKNSYKICQDNCSLNKLRWEVEIGWTIHTMNETSYLR